MNDPAALERLVVRSNFVFAGTVAALGRSALKVIPDRSDLAVARLDRALRIAPVLGNLDGRPITVLLAQGEQVRPGERLIFFTASWVHGEEIAVREVAHLPADEQTEKTVAKIVASEPERHLQARVASAVLIVRGTVRAVERAREIPEPGSEHAPRWMRARIDVRQVLKGELTAPAAPARGRRAAPARGSVVLFFPGSDDIAYRNTPKPAQGQAAVFLLHAGSPPLPERALVAPDRADVQPESRAGDVRKLIGSSTRPR